MLTNNLKRQVFIEERFKNFFRQIKSDMCVCTHKYLYTYFFKFSVRNLKNNLILKSKITKGNMSSFNELKIFQDRSAGYQYLFNKASCGCLMIIYSN